jgi:hypothetical protein
MLIELFLIVYKFFTYLLIYTNQKLKSLVNSSFIITI